MNNKDKREALKYRTYNLIMSDRNNDQIKKDNQWKEEVKSIFDPFKIAMIKLGDSIKNIERLGD